ncbi:MAG: LuxR C-terminal-related transcriptional regulator [Tannerellaceae bacterium]|jgi:DNA-binding NarL/FixJ family response regulator|nr:LuxR C-terminal-related transcriptional regulator [Tannerellaceae bacterium]
MNISLKIVVAEVSAIVRSGVEVQMKRLSGFRFHLLEIARSELVHETIRIHKPDILIINPSMVAGFTLQQLKEECGCPAMKCIALLYNLADRSVLLPFDENISIYDTNDEIKQKVERLYAEELQDITENDEQQILSAREKEIVVCVVRGMTNRAIADRLFLSTHTVITHRRNIARKLQIHSASGLTVYAIVNKLIELKDVGKQ